MRLIIDFPPKAMERIRRLVEAESYRSVQDFVLVAVENQLHLEDADGSGAEIAWDSGRELGLDLANGPSSSTTQSFTKVQSGPSGPAPHPSDLTSLSPLIRVPPALTATVDLPKPEQFSMQCLWGQYNRLFPSVVALRVIANKVAEEREPYIPLSDVYKEAADVARRVGKGLQRVDIKLGNRRGEKLSTALPIGDDEAKAVARFRSQFVGGRHKSGQTLTGLCPQLLFVNITKDKAGDKIGITRFGLKFAQLPCPVLDQPSANVTLSTEQVEFYVDHIAEHLPEELRAMREVLRGIDNGQNTPQALDSVVAKLGVDWSPDVVSTQRTGLVGRLSELNFIEIKRQGKTNSYAVTKTGRDLVLERA